MRARSHDLVRGAIAGAAATLAMSACLIVSERAGLMPGQPPRMAVDRFLPRLDDRRADRIALLAHLVYGAAGGVAPAVLSRTSTIRPSAGSAYGLALWVVGYEGWVPVLGVLPPAHRDHRGRVATMVAGHVVYGVTLAATLRRLRP